MALQPKRVGYRAIVKDKIELVLIKIGLPETIKVESEKKYPVAKIPI